MTPTSRIHVYNRTEALLTVSLEPEGDCIELEPGKKCEIRLSEHDATDELEIEHGNGVIAVHFAATKEVFVDGQQVR